MLDSISHIGPLTNNPSEAKRLQVIRPDQNTPRALMLGRNIDHRKFNQSQNRMKKQKKNRNKMSKKKVRRKSLTRVKQGKRKNANTSDYNIGNIGTHVSVNRKTVIRKVR